MKRPIPHDFDNAPASPRQNTSVQRLVMNAPSSPPSGSILTRDKILARPPMAPRKSKRSRSRIFSSDTDDEPSSDTSIPSWEQEGDSILWHSPVVAEPLLVPDEQASSSIAQHHHNNRNNDDDDDVLPNLPPSLGPRRRLFHAFQLLGREMPRQEQPFPFQRNIVEDSTSDDDDHDHIEDALMMMPRLDGAPELDDDTSSTTSDSSFQSRRSSMWDDY